MSDSSEQHEHDLSSSGPRREDAERGRIIVVADNGEASELARMIEDATARPITVVSNFFEAIGEIATTEMRAAPDAVMAAVDTFGTRASEFVEALRHGDPSVAVLAVQMTPDLANFDEGNFEIGWSSDMKTANAIESFVDAVLTPPVTRLELERAIQSAGSMAGRPRVSHERREHVPELTTAEQSDDDRADDQPHARDESPVDMAERLILERLNAPGAEDDDEDAQHEESRSSKPVSSIPFVTDEAETIADTELIDRILRAPSSLVSTLELAIIARSGSTDVHIADASDNTEAPDSTASEVITYGEQMLGYLVSPSMEPDRRKKWALWASRYLALAERINAWRSMAYTDDLTGAWNRRYFNATMDRTLREARDNRRCVTILLFDIDDFKHFNDEHGHAAGDDILIEVVQLLKSVIRPSDKVCRIGGDEFIVIFYDPEGDRKPGSEHPRDIADIVERFQKQIATHHFPKLGRDAPGRLTISGGLATFPWDGQDVNSLLEHADQATLRAKRAGKDSIILGPA